MKRFIIETDEIGALIEMADNENISMNVHATDLDMDNPIKFKRNLCSLFGLSYHVENSVLIEKISSLLCK